LSRAGYDKARKEKVRKKSPRIRREILITINFLYLGWNPTTFK